MSEILVRLDVSPMRRWFAVVMLLGLGAMLLYIAAVAPPSDLLGLFSLVLFGFGALWFGIKMQRATTYGLILTREGISTSSGIVVCGIDDIASVDRGFFAFKPSNGFLIRLKESGDRHWSPGLWWRVKKRIGVGGVTSRRQAKEAADILSMLVAERSSGKQ